MLLVQRWCVGSVVGGGRQSEQHQQRTLSYRMSPTLSTTSPRLFLCLNAVLISSVVMMEMQCSSNPDTHPTIIHLSTHPCIKLSMHLCIHASIYQTIHASMHPCIYSSMQSCIHASIHPCSHAFMHPCIHPLCIWITFSRLGKRRLTSCWLILGSSRIGFIITWWRNGWVNG